MLTCGIGCRNNSSFEMLHHDVDVGKGALPALRLVRRRSSLGFLADWVCAYRPFAADMLLSVVRLKLYIFNLTNSGARSATAAVVKRTEPLCVAMHVRGISFSR